MLENFALFGGRFVGGDVCCFLAALVAGYWTAALLRKRSKIGTLAALVVGALVGAAFYNADFWLIGRNVDPPIWFRVIIGTLGGTFAAFYLSARLRGKARRAAKKAAKTETVAPNEGA